MASCLFSVLGYLGAMNSKLGQWWTCIWEGLELSVEGAVEDRGEECVQLSGALRLKTLQLVHFGF